MNSHRLTIRTPEGVVFHLNLAGPVSRCLAWLVDALCIFAAIKAANILVGLLGLFNPDLSRAAAILLFFVLNIGYAIALEWIWQGQTIGKRLLRLRVMDMRGLRLQRSQIVIRNLLRAVDSLPMFYLVGGAAALTTPYAQRLGDVAANTIVVREAEMQAPDLAPVLKTERYNTLRGYPHLAARLRRRTAPEEAGLALQALMRRDTLDPDARVTLFEQMAGHFRQKVAFPQEALEGISDEQFIRDVVDVLFRSGQNL